MKSTELKGVMLYEGTDGETRIRKPQESRGRFAVERDYKFIGECQVEKSTNARTGVEINAWDGILVQHVKTAKRFPVGYAGLLGIGFQKTDEGYNLVSTSKQRWADEAELLVAVKAQETFHVSAIEKLEVTPFGGEVGTFVVKDYYIFDKK